MKPSAGPAQRGAALLVLLLALSLVAAYFALNVLGGSAHNERLRLNAAALGQAKESLIGFAATYRDTHALWPFGAMPCPDMTENPLPGGQASASPTCPATAVSAIGRLPWQTLKLPALRDSSGECFWYAVSGSVKDVNLVTPLNWDTLGQFVVQDPGGTVLAGATPHSRPLAVILAPGAALGAQARATGTPAPECGGTINTNNAASYLEGLGTPWPPAASATTTITIAHAASLANGSNNDMATWVSSKDVFDRVKKRSDFRADIDTLLNSMASCISSLPSISNSYAPYKGLGRRSAPIPPNNVLDDFTANCPPSGNQVNVLANWQNNLLYTKPAGSSTVTLNNGVSYANCAAVLLFGGERTAAQTRSNASEIGDNTNNGTPGMYLEGANATTFPNAGTYSSSAGFNGSNASADIARCIKAYTGQQVSSAGGFGAFTTAGVGVSVPGGLPPGVAPGTPTATIGNGAGTNGGCLWYPTAIPLAGKVLRAFYNFALSTSDNFALTGTAPDHGNGFTVQMVRANGMAGPPAACGTQANMGALGTLDTYGSISYIVETDVHRDAANNDPVENHTAIMYGGNLTHTATNGSLTTACNGSAAGCRHSPANKFEELIANPAYPPVLPQTYPATHSQRIEIHTGCDATCTNCNIGAPLPANYSRLSAWVDCVNCNDVRGDLDRTGQAPTVSRCLAPNASLNSVYFGLTGGFLAGGAQQGVTLWNLNLRTE